MGIDLLNAVSQFPSSNDRESPVAWFRTLAPWVGPEAYLHVIFKPAQPAVLSQVAQKLRFPAAMTDFLLQQNGAILFSGDLSVYGVVKSGQLLKRSDRFSLPPFNIETESSSWPFDRDRLLVIGGYRSNGSRACMDRADSRVHVFRKGQQSPIASWPDIDHWLSDEIVRPRALFDQEGKRLGKGLSI